MPAAGEWNAHFPLAYARRFRRKAATDKTIATSIAEASEMLDHADEKTAVKHYIGDAAIKPKKVRPVR